MQAGGNATFAAYLVHPLQPPNVIVRVRDDGHVEDARLVPTARVRVVPTRSDEGKCRSRGTRAEGCARRHATTVDTSALPSRGGGEERAWVVVGGTPKQWSRLRQC